MEIDALPHAHENHMTWPVASSPPAYALETPVAPCLAQSRKTGTGGRRKESVVLADKKTDFALSPFSRRAARALSAVAESVAANQLLPKRPARALLFRAPNQNHSRGYASGYVLHIARPVHVRRTCSHVLSCVVI
ncbi:hypothetical protein BRADI_3g07005v3 [Brachypodium distachyon]|uniref:Uncharacterized protein n=1 Tax=Brachypodium distachyon TaxID=15368 RepID=A0A2K2CVP6_BRADI|nr:hypothetical protein BRADI_3g07005v3 [Brachypodium distachyon]